jgi:predicted N-acetyltransferase YhbS
MRAAAQDFRQCATTAVRMGRLAVDLDFKGVGLGGALLANALLRSAQADSRRTP